MTEPSTPWVHLDSLVQQTIELKAGVPLQKEPLMHNGYPVTAYDDNLAITTDPDRKARRALNVFNTLVARGIIPPLPENPVVLEWGKPEQMKTQFVKVSKDNRAAYIHAKHYDMPDAADPDAIIMPPSPAAETLYVTGTCLFGSASALGITDKGHALELCNYYEMKYATREEFGVIKEILIAPQYHGYEVISPLERENVLKMIDADKIYFNAPLGAYLLYGRDAVAKGIMPPELFEPWADAVFDRVEMAVAMERAATKAEIIPVDPLYDCIDEIMDLSKNLHDIKSILSAKDAWWGMALDHTDTASYTSLSYISFMKVYYDLLNKNPGKDTHVVAVESPEEARIFVGLRHLMQEKVFENTKGNKYLSALYPFDEMLYPDHNGNSSGPFAAHNLLGPNCVDEIIQGHRHVADEDVLRNIMQVHEDRKEKMPRERKKSDTRLSFEMRI